MSETDTAKKLLRQQQLAAWVSEQLGMAEVIHLQSLSGDASFRRYFRCDASMDGFGPTLVAVDAPPDKEKNQEFVQVAGLLANQGVNAPKVLRYDEPRGFLLLNDLGDQLLLPLLDQDSVDALYAQSLAMLERLQQVPTETSGLAAYDAGKLRDEMELFPQWFVETLLQRPLAATERHMLDALFQQLIASATGQPQVFVHRDFHSRNIMVLANGELACIDFQDAVIGPISYDLVSLLRDCYIVWPPAQVKRWCADYAARLAEKGLLDATQLAQFPQWFDWMGLQRHLKVLGIFARLSLRDGKHGYLQDLPLVIRYVVEMLQQYPDFADVLHWFHNELQPLISKQAWADK